MYSRVGESTKFCKRPGYQKYIWLLMKANNLITAKKKYKHYLKRDF